MSGTVKQKEELPECFGVLGFKELPGSVDELRDKFRYRIIVSQRNPSRALTDADRDKLRLAYADCMLHLTGGVGA
jgi:hypothetical protein